MPFATWTSLVLLCVLVAFHSYDTNCALGALLMLTFTSLLAFFQDAHRIGKRPSVVTPNRDSSESHTNYTMVPQSSIGLLNGILIKLLYEYKCFGTHNFFTRFIQTTVTGSFDKKKLPCLPSAILNFATTNKIALKGWARPLHEYTSVDDFFTRRYATLEWGAARPHCVRIFLLLLPLLCRLFLLYTF